MQKKQTATIYDVASRVGVSLATVSRVVNGNSNEMCIRDRIMAVLGLMQWLRQQMVFS